VPAGRLAKFNRCPVNVYETAFNAVVSDPHYQQNLDWGKPRRGHPEATVRAHIQELERNLHALQERLSETDYWKLKLLIHTHDTFKPEAKLGVTITDPRSHASLAREFLAQYCGDTDLLAIVQHHDEPYALWRQWRDKGSPNRGRLAALIENIKDWNLFLTFLIIDGCTEGKSREPLVWFLNEAESRGNCDADIKDRLMLCT
jgi:hypothetical protein